MTNLKPFIDALKAAFNDDTGFLDSNYTDIGDDDVSRVVLDGSGISRIPPATYMSRGSWPPRHSERNGESNGTTECGSTTGTVPKPKPEQETKEPPSTATCPTGCL
jgi:hypothetical protein